MLNPVILSRLTALNRDFYDAHAPEFAESRPRLAMGVQRILAQIPAGARVLEIGCGDGKVARRLNGGLYVGVDASAGMLQMAQTRNAQQPPKPHCYVICADVADPHWIQALPAESFDWVLAFATWQHLPGLALRQRVLNQVAERLAPGGSVAMSNWQFTRSARLQRLIRPWAEIGLTDSDVEPGDYLLSWERGGQRGLRYVHELPLGEAQALAASAHLRITQTFTADGLTKNLADYVVAQR